MTLAAEGPACLSAVRGAPYAPIKRQASAPATRLHRPRNTSACLRSIRNILENQSATIAAYASLCPSRLPLSGIAGSTVGRRSGQEIAAGDALVVQLRHGWHNAERQTLLGLVVGV